MSATSKPYTDLDTVKTLLDSSSTADDDLIDSLIPQAQAAIDSILGYSFQTDTGTRLYDGNTRTRILIDKCLSMTKVEVLSYTVVNNVRTISDATDITGYCVLSRTGLILERENAGYFPLGRNNVRVTGTFGKYSDVPQDIQRAAARIVVHYIKQRDASYQDQTGSAQFGQLTFQQNLPTDVCQLLDRYRQRIFVMGKRGSIASEALR